VSALRRPRKRRAARLPRGAPTAAQAFVARLRLDHARLSRVLREIEVQRARLRSHPELARPVIVEALRYLVHYQDRHHHPREDRLYARLIAARSELRAELRGLVREHRGGAGRSRLLTASLLRLPAARLRRGAGRRFARELQAYVDETRHHMRREERCVFLREIEPQLSDGEWQELVREIVPDDPLADAASLARDYPQLASALAESVHEVSTGTHVHVADAPASRGARSLEALREGTRSLLDAYGELLHEGLGLLRENARSLLPPYAPLATVSALPQVGRRNYQFAVRCVLLPSRLTLDCALAVLRQHHR